MRMCGGGGGKIKVFQEISMKFNVFFQRVFSLIKFCKMRMCGGGGGKVKGDANQASHKLERGCAKIYFLDCDHKRETRRVSLHDPML